MRVVDRESSRKFQSFATFLLFQRETNLASKTYVEGKTKQIIAGANLLSPLTFRNSSPSFPSALCPYLKKGDSEWIMILRNLLLWLFIPLLIFFFSFQSVEIICQSTDLLRILSVNRGWSFLFCCVLVQQLTLEEVLPIHIIPERVSEGPRHCTEVVSEHLSPICKAKAFERERILF